MKKYIVDIRTSIVVDAEDENMAEEVAADKLHDPSADVVDELVANAEIDSETISLL